MVTVEDEELPGEVEPPPDIDPPEAGIGCDPRVKSGTFPLDEYDVPAPRSPVVELEDFGGQPGTDSTNALKQAIASLPSAGGTIQLRSGLYGLSGSNKFAGLVNVTIAGSGEGWGSGFYAVQQPFLSQWRALLEFDSPQGIWLDNLEFDMRNQKIGCLRYWDATDTLFSRLYCHDLGGAKVGNSRHWALAAIKGSTRSKNHREIGNYLARGWGDATPTGGVRGTWGPQDGTGFDGALWEHIWAEDFGHTCLVPVSSEGAPHIVRNCTSFASRGAAVKTETADAVKATGGRQQVDVWYPDTHAILISRCDLRHGAYHGVQAEGVGTSVKDCYIEGNSNGVATYNRCLRLEVVNNVMVNDRDNGIWCSLDEGQKFGSLEFHNNTISGAKRKYGIGFDQKCKRPVDLINITENKTGVGVQPLSTTNAINGHPGYSEDNNGPAGKGAQLPE